MLILDIHLEEQFNNDAITELRLGRPYGVTAAYLDKLERWPKSSTDNPENFNHSKFPLEIGANSAKSAVLRPSEQKPAMIIKGNQNVIHNEVVNPNRFYFRDWIDKYAKTCENMPRNHNKYSLNE